MHYYRDIRLMPDEVAGLNFLWEKIFMQVHLALVGIKNKNERVPVGLSFPGYDTEAHTLGDTLRVLSPDREEIDCLNLENGLLRFHDYVQIQDPKDVPSTIDTYARYQRQRAKSNVARLARRRARRKGISEEQALEAYGSFDEKRLSVPYVNARSLSGNRRFRLFILEEKGVLPVEGDFSCYGLSSSTTVPVF